MSRLGCRRLGGILRLGLTIRTTIRTPHQPKHTRGVQNPAPIPARLQRLLRDHLLAGVLDAVVDTVDVGVDGSVVEVEGDVPDGGRVARFEGEAGVVAGHFHINTKDSPTEKGAS